MKSEKKSILVVNDDQDTLGFLQVLLKNEGYVVWGARNEQGALDRVHENLDLILLDVEQPETSGICKKLKSDSLYKHIPILNISGLVREEHRAQGLQAGVDEYSAKWFDMYSLLQLIIEHL